MAHRFASLAVLLFCTAAAAQTPDPTPPGEYFPLSVGDEWQYAALYDEATPEIVTRVVEAEVTVNDTLYARVRERGYQDGEQTYSTERLWRVDGASGELRERTTDRDRPTLLFCPLDVPFPEGEPFECEIEGEVSAFVFDGAPATGDSRAFKEFGSLGFAQRVVAGVGLVTDDAEVTRQGYALAYARVRQSDGSIYTQGSVIVNGASAPPTRRLALTASPNPVRSKTTVYLSGVEGTARLEVFDALGRHVAVLHDGAVAAGASFSADTTALTPGVYLIRASTDSGTATLAFTVAR